MAEDGHLRVVHRGLYRCVTSAGRVLWQRSLRFRCHYLHSYGLPLALNDGSVWLTSNGRLLRETNGRARLMARGDLGDDSETSPNLGYDGSIYCGGFQTASRYCSETVSKIDEVGLDMHSPAVYPDGSAGLASFYGNGLCRLGANGTLIFRAQAESREQDGLVTLNERDEAACQCLAVDAQGRVLWTLGQSAIYSCYPFELGWVALSKCLLSLLSKSGQVLWCRKVSPDQRMGPRQAVVDDRGIIYVPTATGLDVYDGLGKLLFCSDFEPGDTSTLCPLAPGQMALIHNCSLYLIGQP